MQFTTTTSSSTATSSPDKKIIANKEGLSKMGLQSWQISQAILLKKGTKEQGETEEREDGIKDCH